MSARWDAAGAIGTWVAALLAIIALFGIVGPFLIWRASKTDRNQAVDALERGEAESGGFVSKGIKVSPKIRLYRRVKAPLLQGEPHLPGVKLTRSEDAHHVSQASSGWVQFSLVLQAYKLEMRLGDPLIVSDQRTWLPVHKNWILILGIVGRFGKRPDKGKEPVRLKGGVKSIQAIPGRAFSPHRKGSFHVNFLNWTVQRRDHNNISDIIDSQGHHFKPLSGLIGTIWLRSTNADSETDRENAYFTQHTYDETGKLSLDSLAVGRLFWLSVGCLPSANGSVFSLENVENLNVEIADDESTLTTGRARRSSVATYRGAHFVGDNGSSDSSEQEYPRRRPSQYVLPRSENRRRIPIAPGVPRAFRFSAVNDRVEALASVAKSIEADSDQATVYSLDEVELTEDIRSKLSDVSGSTYLPINCQWVRMGNETLTSKLDSHRSTFLERPAAQVLAQVLLDLPITPEGYIINSNRGSMSRALLCNAAQTLPHLLGKIINDVDSLRIPDDGRDDILIVLDNMLTRTLQFRQDRPFFHAIYELDQALSRIMCPDAKVNTAIGVLMITSAEFRALITQSARLIPESINGTVDLDFATSTLNFPSIMGIVQKFAVDFGVLYPGEDLDATAVVSVIHADVMFAALKASLRSAFLETSLDSLPLFTAFMDMSDVVYLG